jgi:N-acetylmuramoyl-L-alanine amidase
MNGLEPVGCATCAPPTHRRGANGGRPVPHVDDCTSVTHVRARLVFSVSRHRAHLLAVLAVLLGLLTGGAWAQERHNFLSIGGVIIDDAGPYYFIAHGDSGNAFMRAGAFAEAAGLDVTFDAASKRLTFAAGVRQVTIDATADVRAGLVKRSGVVRYDGGSFESPMAILVDGVSYVPITPVVAALGGDSGWHADARVVTIDLPDPSAGVQLATPRLGLTDGVSRVALDLPAGHPYQVAVNGSSLAVLLPGVNAPAFARTVADDPNVAGLGFEVLDGVVALVVRTRHALAPTGQGYRVGSLPRGDVDTVYVDFAPGVTGAVATPMSDGVTAVGPLPTAPLAVADAQPRRHTVVIDAGHGGHDPGAVSSWAREEEIVLDVALRLKALLEAEGVHVVLTRDHDTFLTLQERSTFATTDRNVFVSIHANAADSSSAHGIETWVFGRPLDPGLISRAIDENGGGDVGAARTEEAAAIANDIAGDILRETQLNYSLALADMVQGRMVSATNAADRGVRQNLFYVIRNSRIPAILVELGFVSNPDEGRKLAEAAYRATLSDAIADGILTFLRDGGTLANR